MKKEKLNCLIMKKQRQEGDMSTSEITVVIIRNFMKHMPMTQVLKSYVQAACNIKACNTANRSPN